MPRLCASAKLSARAGDDGPSGTVALLGRRTLARVVPAEVPGLYHQVRADGRLSLPANLSWAKNGALGAALRDHPELEQLPVSSGRCAGAARPTIP